MADTAGKSTTDISPRIEDLLASVRAAKVLKDLRAILPAFYAMRGYHLTGLGVFRLKGAPVRTVIYDHTMRDGNLSPGTVQDELRWAICAEAEAIMRPFDVLEHEFTAKDDRVLLQLRATLREVGIGKLMVIPMQIANATSAGVVAIPSEGCDHDLGIIIHELFQLTVALFETFPHLGKWPDEYRLSARECEVLQLTAQGQNEAHVACTLNISKHTVRKHIENCKRKLSAMNKAHAVSIGLQDREIV